jgi:hypothetical protein
MDLITRHTTIILKKGKPEASGVFVKINQGYFLISTAHQYWNNKTADFDFVYDQNPITMAGNHIYNSKNDDERYDLDFAVLKIDNRIVRDFMSDNDFYDLESETLNQNSNIIKFHLHGFLANKVKFEISQKIIRSFEYSFLNIIHPKELSFFFYIDYQIRKVGTERTGRSRGPTPKGCSGAGIWAITSERLHLIGLLVEYDSTSSLLKAVKIQTIKDFIIAQFLQEKKE